MRLDPLCLLLVLGTTAWAKPVPNQEVCFLVLGRERHKIHLIYDELEDDSELWSLDTPLPNCTGASAPVDLDTCTACVQEQEEVMVQCLLKHPEKKLVFEAPGGGGGGGHLSGNKTQCPGPLTAAAPTTTTAGSDLGLKVGLLLVLLGVVLPVVVVLLVLYRCGFFQRKKIMSSLERCRRPRAPRHDQKAGEQTSANGLLRNQSKQTSANGLLKDQSHAPQTDSDQSEAG